jgi:hypothetical protein
MSGQPTPTNEPPPPTGNTAELLKRLGETNTKEINLFSTAIGAIADNAGAVGAVFSVVETIIKLFGKPEDPNEQLAEILKKLEAFAVMFASFKARQTQLFWTQLATQVSAAVSVVESLGGFVHAQPPLTDNDRHTHIDTCLTPLNALSDTTVFPETGSFFLAAFSDQTYWTDAGMHMQQSFVDGGEANPGLHPSEPVDAGYGTQAPQVPSDNLVFSYLYVLPYYLKAVSMATSVGASFYADFGKNSDREQDAVILFADFLTGIHNKIADEGIRKLTPPDPTDVGWRGDLIRDVIVPGIVMGTSDPPNIDRMTFEVGAVEIFSGYSFVTTSPTFVFGTAPATQQMIFRKLQVRALRGMMNVYLGVGLSDVWNTINKLNGVAGHNLIPHHKLAHWSFREIFDLTSVAGRSDEFLHFSDLAAFIEQTPPLDTATSGDFLVSWRNLLEPA